MNIEQLKLQLSQCVSQRDEYASSFQQAIGAINLLQEQIKILLVEEAAAAKQLAEKEKADAEMLIQLDKGELDNGNVDGETTE